MLGDLDLNILQSRVCEPHTQDAIPVRAFAKFIDVINANDLIRTAACDLRKVAEDLAHGALVLFLGTIVLFDDFS